MQAAYLALMPLQAHIGRGTSQVLWVHSSIVAPTDKQSKGCCFGMARSSQCTADLLHKGAEVGNEQGATAVLASSLLVVVPDDALSACILILPDAFK